MDRQSKGHQRGGHRHWSAAAPWPRAGVGTREETRSSHVWGQSDGAADGRKKLRVRRERTSETPGCWSSGGGTVCGSGQTQGRCGLGRGDRDLHGWHHSLCVPFSSSRRKDCKELDAWGRSPRRVHTGETELRAIHAGMVFKPGARSPREGCSLGKRKRPEAKARGPPAFSHPATEQDPSKDPEKEKTQTTRCYKSREESRSSAMCRVEVNSRTVACKRPFCESVSPSHLGACSTPRENGKN